MKVGEDTAYLLSPTACANLCNAAGTINANDITILLQHIIERAPLNIIHYKVVLAQLNEEVAHTRNTGMVQVEQQGRLAFKPLDSLLAITFVLKFVQHLFNRAR